MKEVQVDHNSRKLCFENLEKMFIMEQGRKQIIKI